MCVGDAGEGGGTRQTACYGLGQNVGRVDRPLEDTPWSARGRADLFAMDVAIERLRNVRATRVEDMVVVSLVPTRYSDSGLPTPGLGIWIGDPRTSGPIQTPKARKSSVTSGTFRSNGGV